MSSTELNELHAATVIDDEYFPSCSSSPAININDTFFQEMLHLISAMKVENFPSFCKWMRTSSGLLHGEFNYLYN
jgi:hypothetical protein